MIDIDTPAASVQIGALPEDPHALARTILDHQDPDYAVQVYEALRLGVAPSFTDVLTGVVSGYTPPPEPDPTTFSDLQLDIVRHLERVKRRQTQEHDDIESANPRLHARIYPRDFDGGVHFQHLRPYWRPEDLGGDMTPSRRVSISRSLRRLEERGIVDRFPGPGGRRSVRVNLTPDGEKLARRLVNE